MNAATSPAGYRSSQSIAILVVPVVLLLCGCATGVFYSSPAKMAGLSLGMEKKAVMKVVGKPYSCSTRLVGKEMNEVWEYREFDAAYLGASDQPERTYEVYFVNGKVVNWGRSSDIREAERKKELEKKWGDANE